GFCSTRQPKSRSLRAIFRRKHASQCAVWTDTGGECAGAGPAAGKDQKGHGRQAPEDDRPRGTRKSPGAVPARTVLRPLLLRRTEGTLVRVDGARARRADYEADAESCGTASHGAGDP